MGPAVRMRVAPARPELAARPPAAAAPLPDRPARQRRSSRSPVERRERYIVERSDPCILLVRSAIRAGASQRRTMLCHDKPLEYFEMPLVRTRPGRFQTGLQQLSNSAPTSTRVSARPSLLHFRHTRAPSVFSTGRVDEGRRVAPAIPSYCATASTGCPGATAHISTPTNQAPKVTISHTSHSRVAVTFVSQSPLHR
jgi:hypothetical protein